ncbi:heterokaryon incompatibility, partial [Usnea florida]
LSTHTLADAPEYECLSYVWGTENSHRVLWLDREVIAIGKSLDKALGRLQHESESRFLWIDLVCINQQDLEERNQQVQLMYRIFCQAKRVIAYLGEEADGSQNVPDFLRQIQAATSTWTMLKRLVMRSWFVRVWIMQEALAARY